MVDDADRERVELLEAVLDITTVWLRERCRKAVATWPAIDADDVFQEVMLRLLDSRTAIDPARVGLRTFLGRCVDWVVCGLDVAHERQGGVAISEEKFNAALEARGGDGDLDEPGGGPPLIDSELLSDIRLSQKQIETVCRSDADRDLSWKEFALLIGRGYSAVRKDRERALRKIESWLGLDAEERRVFVTHRRTGSVARTAAALHLPVPDCCALLRSAQLKIRLRLYPREEG